MLKAPFIISTQYQRVMPPIAVVTREMWTLRLPVFPTIRSQQTDKFKCANPHSIHGLLYNSQEFGWKVPSLWKSSR